MAQKTLVELRQDKGLDLEALARACGTSVYNLKRIEAGYVVLTAKMRNNLAAALGVAPSEILVQA